MSAATPIPRPPPHFEATARYAIRPRERRAFHTVLDAGRLLAGAAPATSVVRHGRDGGDVVLTMEHPMLAGTMREEMRFTETTEGLLARSLAREVSDAEGRCARRELVPDFRHDAIGFPSATYPEVALPFMLGWMPHDGARRSVYAWINDRFVAKVYVEIAARGALHLGARSYDTVEMVMYPDLNDWVPLGAVLTRLAKPFLPKYRMWFESRAPHKLVRFEGPYGPPGAPELVLEIID